MSNSVVTNSPPYKTEFDSPLDLHFTHLLWAISNTAIFNCFTLPSAQINPGYLELNHCLEKHAVKHLQEVSSVSRHFLTWVSDWTSGGTETSTEGSWEVQTFWITIPMFDEAYVVACQTKRKHFLAALQELLKKAVWKRRLNRVLKITMKIFDKKYKWTACIGQTGYSLRLTNSWGSTRSHLNAAQLQSNFIARSFSQASWDDQESISFVYELERGPAFPSVGVTVLLPVVHVSWTVPGIRKPFLTRNTTIAVPLAEEWFIHIRSLIPIGQQLHPLHHL